MKTTPLGACISIDDIFNYCLVKDNISIIHYVDKQQSKKTFIGIHPSKVLRPTNHTEQSNITNDINRFKDNSVWVVATTYEWGHAQLFSEKESSETAIFIQYHSGFWIDHSTSTIQVFGDININDINNSPPIDAIESDITLQPLWTKSDFSSAIITAQNAIKEGDIYQVNISYPSIINTTNSMAQLYCHMMQAHSPSYGAFISIENCRIASCSPEEFFYVKDNFIRTQPIKGTIGRKKNKAEDLKAYQQLLHSSKDKAELTMITDLLRNDLGKCCNIGSITVNHLHDIQKHTYVYHLASTITGKLKPTYSAVDALIELSPGGSITGCPKYSACQIIQDIEPYPRKYYTGHIGFISANESAFNVAIRTCYQEDNGPIYTHSGCGITINSDPDTEYQESIDKLRFINTMESTHANH